jgi:hypothetical protein
MAYAHAASTVAATVAAFAVGGLWYGPLFGKAWMAEMQFTAADKGRVNPLKLFGLTLVLEGVSAFFLGHLLTHTAQGAYRTMMISTGMGLGFVGPAIGVNYLYGMKSLKLMALDIGHWIAAYAAMGAVFVVLGA